MIWTKSLNQKFLRLTKKGWSACNLYIWHWQTKLLTYIIRQSTNILLTLNGKHIHRVSGATDIDQDVDHHSADISIDTSVDMLTDISQSLNWPSVTRSTYQSSVNGQYVDRHISWVSVDMSTNTSVGCQSICRLNYIWSKMFILSFLSYMYTIDTCRVIIYTVHVTKDGHLVPKCHIWECFSHENLIITWISLLHNFCNLDFLN